MEELVDAGKVRFIGVSNFSVRDLVNAQAALSRHIVGDTFKKDFSSESCFASKATLPTELLAPTSL
jgi:predicted oxidoreductase